MHSISYFLLSGCSPKMSHYYAYWERNLYSAVLSMLCNSLSELYSSIERDTGVPLFSIDCILSVPEIVIHPPGSEIFKMYTNTVCTVTAHNETVPYIYIHTGDLVQYTLVSRISVTIVIIGAVLCRGYRGVC